MRVEHSSHPHVHSLATTDLWTWSQLCLFNCFGHSILWHLTPTLCARALLSTSQPLGFSHVNHQLQGTLGVVKRFAHAVLHPLGFSVVTAPFNASLECRDISNLFGMRLMLLCFILPHSQRGHLPISLLIIQTHWVPCFRRGVSTNIP